MNKIVVLSILCLSQSSLFGQSHEQKVGFFEVYINNEWAISVNATPPSSPNETGDFDWAVISNVKYPDVARRMGIEGNVLLEIEIDKNGSTLRQSIKSHIGADTDKELKKLIPKLPTSWTPASFNGEKVESRVLILFRFTLFDVNTIETTDKVYKCYKIRPMTPTTTSVTKADQLVVTKEKEEKSKKKKK